MRPYRNISKAELEALGASEEWNPQSLLHASLPVKALWVHARREKIPRFDQHKIITIYAVDDGFIRTDFGLYALETGINALENRFVSSCRCAGRLYLLS